jgi:RND family efflux transporter MFP subunit
VEVAKVTRGNIEVTSTLTGRVEAQTEVPVPAKLSAQVVAVRVRVGEKVKAGQVLVELDKKDVSEQVRQAEANLKVAEASLPPASGESAAAASARVALESAQADLKRIESLKEQGLASEQAWEQAKARAAGAAAQYQAVLDQERAAKARYEQAQAALELARSQLADATITAPISGIVASLPVEVGQTVSPGVAVATIVNMDQVKIKLNVPEKDVVHLKEGQAAKVRVTSLKGKEFTGKLTSLAPAADARTRSFLAEVTLDNPGYELKPGMFAEVRLVTETRKDVVMVPQDAVLVEGDEHVVYVVSGNRAHRREVKLGLGNDEAVEVLSGVKEGEDLVVTGQDYLEDGVPVTVVEGRGESK